MNTPSSYTIDYGNIPALPAEPRIDAAAPLYASEDGLVASLSNSECIFQVKRSGETHVMTFQVLQALDQSREFRSLDEHVARILATIPGLQAQRESVLRVLEGLIARNLLVSDRDFLARISVQSGGEPAPLRAVFIRACDRPQQLERLLMSLTEYERRFRAGRRYVLLDDSRSREAADRHRDLLREFARATGCQLTYLGAAERQRFIERLARAVPRSSDTLPFLLSGAGIANRFGGGGGWNMALLLSAGARMILLDDDHRLPLRRPRDAREGLNASPIAGAFTEFFRNIDNARGAGEEFEGDPLELHLEVVGRSLGQVLANPRYSIERASLCGLPLSSLDHLHSDSPILTTHHGAYGSSRTESGYWLYQLSAADRARFVEDRDSYLRNVEGGSIWYGYHQARLATAASFSPFAIDNADVLPCTNPVGRGEDSLFSRVTELARENALIMELPVAIGHVQETQRARSAQTLTAHTPRFNYFVGEYVQRQLPEFHAAAPAQRLQLLAAHLRDIAEAGETVRLRMLREFLAHSRADLIERLQTQYDAASDMPIYWQADVRSIVEANGRALISKAPPRLADWPETADAAACARFLRDETRALSAAFEAWPRLWEHARERGEQLLDAI